MHIRFFFRKSSPVFHSIEKLFNAICNSLPIGLASLHFSPYQSKGFINRIRIGLDARKHQSEINHITGDIHFIALFLKKKKTILTIHDIGNIKQGNFIKRFVIRLFWFSLPIRRVQFVTVISEFTKQELLSNFRIKKEKVFVIDNCISDIYQYHVKTEIALKPIILQIGTKPNKNFDNLLPALENIDCKLIVVGKLSGYQLSNIEKYKIDFENYLNISNEELLSLYIRCDILAYVSTYEGFGMPVVEANAVGRPVLASDIEPIKSIAGNSALLVNPFNIEDIRNGMIKIINDRDFCNKLVENGLANAKKYRSQKIANEYLELYKKILELNGAKNEKNPGIY